MAEAFISTPKIRLTDQVMMIFGPESTVALPWCCFFIVLLKPCTPPFIGSIMSSITNIDGECRLKNPWMETPFLLLVLWLTSDTFWAWFLMGFNFMYASVFSFIHYIEILTK